MFQRSNGLWVERIIVDGKTKEITGKSQRIVNRASVFLYCVCDMLISVLGADQRVDCYAEEISDLFDVCNARRINRPATDSCVPKTAFTLKPCD